MNQPLLYGAADAADLDPVVRILSHAFGVTAEEERAWIERSVGATRLRVVRQGQAIAACLSLIDGMGLWFGGKRVPAAGIAGVASDAAARGRGGATALMRAAVAELHGAGVPLAALYPATLPLYRRAGFEVAGVRASVRVPPAALDLKDRSLPVVEVGPADRARLEVVHRAARRFSNGAVDRNDYLWGRVFAPGRKPATGFAVEGASGIEGYLFLQWRDHSEIHVSDFVALTPGAATRLLTFLADHRTTCEAVVWHGSAVDPLLALVREQAAKVTIDKSWMLRIVDVPAALASRGYAPGLSARLELEIFDEVITANRGRFVFEVEGGVGRVRPGGDGSLKLHVRGLAALYSGHMTPAQLALTGLLDGDERERAVAAAVFAGPQPAMSDYF